MVGTYLRAGHRSGCAKRYTHCEVVGACVGRFCCFLIESKTCKFNLQVLLLFFYDDLVMDQKNFEAEVLEFAQAVGKLVRCARAAATSNELSWTETAVLNRLAREGPTTTAELARAQGMRPQSMRTIVASLEGLGMVARRAHATDGRQVNLELTEKGKAEQRSSTEAKRNWLAQAVGKLNAEEQETLFATGKLMRRLVESGQ